MEFGDWEYLSENNLFSSQIIEDNSNFVHEEDQQVVAGQVALIPSTEHDQGDVSVKEIREMTEECDAVPQVQLESTMNDEIEESKEVKFEEKDVLKEENLETEISRSFEFVEEEEEELEEVKEVIGGREPSSGIDCVNGSDQRNSRGRLRGIGALSSVGIAAATLSMLIFGGCKRSQSRELQMQIYADDKVSKVFSVNFFISSISCKIVSSIFNHYEMQRSPKFKFRLRSFIGRRKQSLLYEVTDILQVKANCFFVT